MRIDRGLGGKGDWGKLKRKTALFGDMNTFFFLFPFSKRPRSIISHNFSGPSFGRCAPYHIRF